MGDSVLNNAKYVEKQDTVYSKLKQKMDNVYLFAEDGATLMDAYQQLDKIPVSLNNQNSFLFISVGGNNILNPLFQNTDKTVDELFEKYMTFLSSLKIKMDNINNIILLNIYYPTNNQFNKYHPYIYKWNQLLNENQGKYGYQILGIDKVMTNKYDFIYNIEPSVIGGSKIADAIVQYN